MDPYCSCFYGTVTSCWQTTLWPWLRFAAQVILTVLSLRVQPILLIMNNHLRYFHLPAVLKVMPTQDFHLLQNVLLMDGIIFSHKTDSFILTYCPFEHQMNKISLLVLLNFIFIILFTYGYLMTFQKSRWYPVTFQHLHYLILPLNFMPSFNYFTIMTIINKLHVLCMQDIYVSLFHYKSSSSHSFCLHACPLLPIKKCPRKSLSVVTSLCTLDRPPIFLIY